MRGSGQRQGDDAACAALGCTGHDRSSGTGLLQIARARSNNNEQYSQMPGRAASVARLARAARWSHSRVNLPRHDKYRMLDSIRCKMLYDYAF